MLTAAGILIPVIIHLWNRSQGKTRKVGSIELLQQSFRQQAKKLQLQDLLLLFLRSLLILLVALALSAPVWRSKADFRQQKGWVLMEKRDLQQAYHNFKPLIDSLTARQYEFHYFTPGFPKYKLENALKGNPDTSTAPASSYWSLVSALNRQVPATLPLFLFTTNSLKRFTGSRPQAALNLHWQTFTAPDSTGTQIVKARQTGSDSILVTLADTRPAGTAYRFVTVSATPHTTTGITVSGDARAPLVSLDHSKPVPADTSSLHITLFTDKYPHDALYLRAALEAIGQFSKQKLRLTVTGNRAAIRPGEDWLFWLSDQPVQASGAQNLFVYEPGKAEQANSTVLTTVRESADEDVTLYRRTPAKGGTSTAVQTVWKDGFGNPLLELEKGPSAVYHFYSRFDPSWSDLPWSATFPQVLYHLLNRPATLPETDKRVIDDHQIMPVAVKGDSKEGLKAQLSPAIDLSVAFWIAAFIVLFLERLLSLRTSKEK